MCFMVIWEYSLQRDDNGYVAYGEWNLIQPALHRTNYMDKKIYQHYLPTEIFVFSKVPYTSTLHECDSYSNTSRVAVLKLPIKAWRFPFPLSFDYFNKPCTTAVVKKTGTPSFCTPIWLMIFVFCCKLFWKRSYSTWLFWKRIKKYKLNIRF